MARISLLAVFIALAGFAVPPCFGQGDPVSQTIIPFSEPSKPGNVRVDVQYGGAVVKEHKGKEVIVEVRVLNKDPSKKAPKGMKQIKPKIKVTTTSSGANGAPVSRGCKSRKATRPTNNMLAWKSRPRPVT